MLGDLSGGGHSDVSQRRCRMGDIEVLRTR